MKSNFTVTVCYMIYMAVAICLYPIKNVQDNISQPITVSQVAEEKKAEVKNAEILHEGLLFENAGF